MFAAAAFTLGVRTRIIYMQSEKNMHFAYDCALICDSSVKRKKISFVIVDGAIRQHGQKKFNFSSPLKISIKSQIMHETGFN